MKTIKLQFNISSISRVLKVIVMVLTMFSCQKEDSDENTLLESTNLKGKKAKINICHYDADTDSWKLLNLNENAWKAHKKHGDVRLDDQDGDGFVPDNACGYGQMGDCDDNDPLVNPGVEEVCNNGIDDNCNGEIDEDCSAELTDYEILKILYEVNPGNTLDWDLNDTSMESWGNIGLDSHGNVIGISLGTDGMNRGVTVLPAEIGMLENLEGLIVLRELESIPSELGQLSNLRILGIIDTEATIFPEEIGNLNLLEFLTVIGNSQITNLPSSIGNLTNLKRMDVTSNGLISIPPELANLTQLDFLDLQFNPVTVIPQAVCDLADADTEVLLDSDDVCQ